MFKSSIKEELKKIITELNAPEDVKFNIEKPVAEKFGDFSTNLAMVLAKELKMPPVEIAKIISTKFPILPFLERIEIEHPGFINFYLKKEALLLCLDKILTEGNSFGSSNIGAGEKIVLEHTNVNPNKALHVGHLRSTCLGSSCEKILEFLGYDVEVHYYVDDTGVQVAVTGLGLKELDVKEKKDEKFDHFAGRVYTQTMKLIAENKDLEKKQKEIIKILDKQQEGATLDFMKKFAKRILECNLETTYSFDVQYDLLVWESDIIKAGFFDKAFEIMKQNPNFYFSKKGKNKGCFVMKDQEEKEKVILKSTGEATYTGKDIAYHFWKFNLLGEDFKYKKWEGKSQQKKSLWTTSSDGKKSENFGKAQKVVNFIDVRQSFPQEMVNYALQTLGFTKEAQNMQHVGYGIVSLSPRTARVLGKETSLDKQQYAMSGRDGLFVLADDLLEMVQKQVWKKHSKSPAIEAISKSAIKYSMLNYNPYSDVVFSYDKALDIQGNSGPYLQYVFARCKSILKKAEKEGKKVYYSDKYAQIHLSDEEKSVLRYLYLFPQVIRRSGKNYSPSLLCNYLFKLGSRFNTFYAKHHVLEKGQDKLLTDFRILLVASTAQVLENGLKLLGIEPVEKM